MGFRRTVFVVITAVVLAIAALEGILDLLVDRWAVQIADQPTHPAGSLIRTLAENEVWLDLLDLPLFVGIAFLAAWLLTRTISRPVKRLTEATRVLAQDRAPGFVPVPPGNDDLSELGRSFNAMTTSIQGYLERERAFTRYASHELRTPISAIKVQLERVELGLASLDDVTPRLTKNLEHSEALLDALLALARSSVREGNRQKLAVLLGDALDGVEDEGVTLEPPIPAVSVMEPTLVRQAIWNLVDNARKHGRPPVRVYAKEANGWLDVRVVDAGDGVPPDALPRIQEAFYRQDASAQGVGLGLSLVSTVADTLGGRLTFRNLERGFEASLQLPVPE